MRREPEDDFVLTISDNDDLNISEADESSTEIVPSESKKRRRAEKPVERSSKKRKRAELAQGALNTDSEPESESDKEKALQDGVIDSDFEFDVGVNANDVIEDFDGWGVVEDESKSRKPQKRAIDVDDIIARRALKPSSSVSVQPGSDDGNSDESGVGSDEEDGEAGEEIEFEDENVAEDSFGGAALSDEESEVDGDVIDGTAEDQNADSDNDSTASPVAHPDDVASGDESETSQIDAEELAKEKAFFSADQNTAPLTSTDTFQQFSLSRPLLRALATLSFTTPTPIQTRAIPVALQGLDVVGSAQTGSGKTAAFLLPILERLIYRPRKIPTTRVAILMPTRELAVQCYSVAMALARYTDITFAQIVGGFSLREQEAVLRKRPDVVIATPGRFIDHMRNSASFVVENLEILVLDEADRMLEQGFADELDEIIKTIPRSRQTMLFSATMTSSVDKLVRVGMNKPVRVSVDAKRSTVAGLVQEFVRLRPGKEELRLASLCMLCTTVPDYQTRTIVFFRQKKEAHRVRIIFGLLGIKAGELHGSMTQEQRIAAVNGFRDGKTTHLLATDVASRGLDIKNVLSIINYEAPQTHEIYLHRVGRTARAGKTGKSCTIAAEPDRKVVKAAVKAARDQNAKVVSRALDQTEVAAMNEKVESLADDIEEILKEEKQEKQLAQMESDVQRGENLVKHHDEIMSRPKRTWFESEKEKQAAKDRAKAEMNGILFKGEKKKLSNKDKKKLDLHKDRLEGRQWKKGKGDAESAAAPKKKDKSRDKSKTRPPGGSKPLKLGRSAGKRR